MKNFKKLLGIVLCICMLLGVTSVTASAASLENSQALTQGERTLVAVTATTKETYYEIGSEIDKNDFTVIAEYSDGTKEERTDFTVNKIDTTNAGSFNVEIMGPQRWGLGKKCYAKVTLKGHIITFDPTDGRFPEGTKTSVELRKHDAVPDNTVSFPKPTREGYVFDGWFTAMYGGDRMLVISKYSESMTLYAQWISEEELEEEKKEEAAKEETKQEELGTEVTNMPGKVATPTLVNKKKGQVKIKFEKVANVTAYEIVYSTSEQFTADTTKTVTSIKPNKKIKKLTKNQTYYVKVRAYKTDVTGKKAYGEYSAVKSIIIKK